MALFCSPSFHAQFWHLSYFIKKFPGFCFLDCDNLELVHKKLLIYLCCDICLFISVIAFIQVFDITSLQIFSPYELDYLLCGRRELWKVFFSTEWFAKYQDFSISQVFELFPSFLSAVFIICLLCRRKHWLTTSSLIMVIQLKALLSSM